MKLVCEHCLDDNIERRAWVDANNEKIYDWCSDDDIEDQWCCNCQEHVEFILIKENSDEV